MRVAHARQASSMSSASTPGDLGSLLGRVIFQRLDVIFPNRARAMNRAVLERNLELPVERRVDFGIEGRRIRTPTLGNPFDYFLIGREPFRRLRPLFAFPLACFAIEIGESIREGVPYHVMVGIAVLVQIARFEQARLQREGVAVGRNRVVAGRLHVLDDQKRRVGPVS